MWVAQFVHETVGVHGTCVVDFSLSATDAFKLEYYFILEGLRSADPSSTVSYANHDPSAH